MRILSYQNSQYAGMRNQNVSFRPGMNVILGNNETGKSTILTGIYDTLMMHSNLNFRQDTEFINQRFPVGGGNCIDGTVLLETAGQEITIKKRWDKNKKDSYTELDSGRQYSGEEAEKQIKKLLDFGEAIYNNIIFGRQNNENAILDWLCSFLNANFNSKIDDDSIINAREKITEVLSAAEGIPEDLYLAKIEEKLKNLSSHWDFSSTPDGPEKGRGIENPWEHEVGEILRLYYQLENQRKEYNDHQELIQSFSSYTQSLSEKQEEKKYLKENLENLQQVQANVNTKDHLLTILNQQAQNITDFCNIRDEWCSKIKSKENLSKLFTQAREKKKRIRIQELNNNLKNLDSIFKSLTNLQNAIIGFENITDDIQNYNKLQNDIQIINGALGSSKFHAKITMLSNHNIQVSTADEQIPFIKGQYDSDISGFVKITIPGIAEIIISPQELDISALQEELGEKEKQAANILKQYQVESRKNLEQKYTEIMDANKEIDELKKKYNRILGDSTEEQLINEKEKLQIDENIDIPDNLVALITEELKTTIDLNNLDICIPVIQAKIHDIDMEIQGYIQKHCSIDNLNDKIKAEEHNKENTLEDSKKYESIMTKEDFERKVNEIKTKLGDKNSSLTKEINDLNQKIGETRKDAEDIDLDAEEREIQNSEILLKQQKKLYGCYDRIKKDFNKLKEKQSNKFDAFYHLFNTYLSDITEEQVQAGNEKLKTNSGELYYETLKKPKGNNLKTLLSQGTKQSILLAFRLALLKYYYPEDGGVIVLDDILLDMDSKRRECSVKLLQDFSINNQVIFTTCDPAIADMLGGNQISL